jgi:hypothetical protein
LKTWHFLPPLHSMSLEHIWSSPAAHVAAQWLEIADDA